MRLNGIKLCKRLFTKTWRVAKLGFSKAQAQPREQRPFDFADDFQFAPGLLFDLLGNLRFVVVRIQCRNGNSHASHNQHDQQQQSP